MEKKIVCPICGEDDPALLDYFKGIPYCTRCFEVSNGMIMLVKPFRHRTLEERAAEYGGQLHLDGEFDWGEPVGREIWE